MKNIILTAEIGLLSTEAHADRAAWKIVSISFSLKIPSVNFISWTDPRYEYLTPKFLLINFSSLSILWLNSNYQ